MEGEGYKMHVRRIKSKEDLHEVEVMLFVEAMMKEVELGPKIWETFESRLARELSNDKSEELVPGCGFLLTQEFWKFMYKNAVEILNQKWEGNMSQELNEKTKEGWHFTASFPAPYYLGIVWKTFIRYDEGYRAFCENLCGGYIDRPEPEFEKYKEI